MIAPPPALAVRDLTVLYHGRPALKDVELEIQPGQLVGVVGPNGAGKSTLLKACLGLVPCASGEVRFHGKPYEESRGSVAYVPQRESVDWGFPVSALDVVAMGTYGRLGLLRPLGRAQRAEAMEALRAVGMDAFASRQIGRLSGGQQQRVFLARALAQHARTYLMDEPLASVDAATEERIIDLLRLWRSRGATVVVVHHDLESARDIFDWVVLLNTTVVASGPAAEVLTAGHLRTAYGGHFALLEGARFSPERP